MNALGEQPPPPAVPGNRHHRHARRDVPSGPGRRSARAPSGRAAAKAPAAIIPKPGVAAGGALKSPHAAKRFASDGSTPAPPYSAFTWMPLVTDLTPATSRAMTSARRLSVSFVANPLS